MRIFPTKPPRDFKIETAVIATIISEARDDRVKNGYNPLVTIDCLSKKDLRLNANKLKRLDIDLETLCRILTKDLKDPQQGSKKPGLQFTEIIAEKQYAHLHNILVIAETNPSLKDQILDDLLKDRGKLLEFLTPAAENPKLPKEVRDKIATITEIANAKIQEKSKIATAADDPGKSLADGAPSVTIKTSPDSAKTVALDSTLLPIVQPRHSRAS